ncbi:MAG: hypothetical protein ACKVRN_02420 [Pyrinomonadaceae bacterium]
MRFLATIFLFGFFVNIAHPQPQKTKSAASKAKPSVEKTKAATAKPKTTGTPSKRPSEQVEWDKASAISDAVESIAALRKFVEAFPKSTRKAKAFESIAETEAALGNEKLAGGDALAAAELFIAAAEDAPKPLPEKLFSETLSKFPTNLYFRGFRDEALQITKIFEDKADTNVGQLLNIAAFYISVENGSEARRVAENTIRIDPNSSAAYQTLGLANRLDFRLEESAAAYTKALELEPDSLPARRGLAEMKRSLGLPNEAATLYSEILATEEASLPARTGLILALFDAEKRTEAEAEMTKSLKANPGNVILLAGAAYWYAAHNEGAQAVAMAQKAIETDPRFIWSHLALARGLLSQNKPLDAEKALLAAQRYGNFPTLEYEIASARLAAGLYREAVEELSKSFSVNDGVIRANVGGRVPLESKDFTELVGFERRASIFAPTAADNPDNAAKLKALLEFKQELSSPELKVESLTTTSDNFIQGDDKMKIHRQIFVASELLDKKIAFPKVVEITKAATSNVDAGLDIPEPATTVMASELYESRAIAAARGQYVNVPQVPRSTLLSVLRGRIEEISGWAYYHMDDAAQASVHLKRAVGVLPVDSAWWRSSTWRLGTALVVGGKDAEALEAYIKSYKSTGADAVRYKAIEAVYRRVNGNTLGLEEKIGRDPSQSVDSETVAQKTEPTPEVKIKVPSAVPVATEPASTSISAPESSPTAEPIVESTPETSLIIDTAPIVESKIESTTETETTETPKLETTPADALKVMSTVLTSPIAEPTPANVEEVKQTPTPVTTQMPTPQLVLETQLTSEEKPKSPEGEKTAVKKELFPSVIIMIPAPETAKIAVREPETKAEPSPSPTPTPEIKSCSLFVSDEILTFQKGGGDLAVIVRREGDGDLEGLTAVSSSPENITVRPEKIDGIKTQALYVVHLLGSNPGEYQIFFEMPCGKKEIAVKVP